MFPEGIDLRYENSIKEEDEFFNFRKEYQVIYQNLFKMNCLIDYIINSLNIQINRIKQTNKVSYQEIELPLFLLITLHQVPNKQQKDINLLKEPFFNALQINFIGYKSEVVIMQYHEMLKTYIQFYIGDESSLKIVIEIYLGEKGILFPNIKIGSKIAAVFVKFIEKAKQSISFMATETVVKLKNTLDTLVDCKNFTVSKLLKLSHNNPFLTLKSFVSSISSFFISFIFIP